MNFQREIYINGVKREYVDTIQNCIDQYKVSPLIDELSVLVKL